MADVELANFSAIVDETLRKFLPLKFEWVADLYVKNRKFVNYCFVCGVLGVLVNMAVLLTLSKVIPLFFANLIAIAAGMANNYYLTVGPLAYYFDLREAPKE